MTNSQRFPLLRGMDVLQGIPTPRAEAFLNACNSREFSEPTTILVQGEMPKYVFFVARGAVEVSFVSPEGHRAILRLARPGNALGLFETVGHQHCAATCKALPGSEVLACTVSQLKVLYLDPNFTRNLAVIACQMLEHDNTYKAIDQFYSSEQRICRYLTKFAGDGRVFVQNQSYLANIVGCTRQTVNKELSHLREQAVIAITKGKINILDPEGLERRIKELDDRSRKRK